MAAENAHPPLESRPATPEDLIDLCRRFNAAGVKYVVIGGMAMIHHGLLRLTSDIDVLVDAGEANIERIRTAMRELPDNAVAEVLPGDVKKYNVVRVADEFVTDLMQAACGVDYAEAARDAQQATYDGVTINFASPSTLLRTKQTHREKDSLDRNYLTVLMREKKT